MLLLRALAAGVAVLIVAIVLMQIVMFGLMAVALTGGPGCWFAPHPDHFERTAWLEAHPDDGCGTRYGMVGELIANHLRPGTGRADVEALLGPPEDPDYGYQLGCWIDCDWVVIEYDASGHVERAYRAQD